MSDKHLLLAPHKIGKRDDAWWYEDRCGITVIINLGPLPSTSVNHPSRSVRSAPARQDKT